MPSVVHLVFRKQLTSDERVALRAAFDSLDPAPLSVRFPRSRAAGRLRENYLHLLCVVSAAEDSLCASARYLMDFRVKPPQASQSSLYGALQRGVELGHLVCESGYYRLTPAGRAALEEPANVLRIDDTYRALLDGE